MLWYDSLTVPNFLFPIKSVCASNSTMSTGQNILGPQIYSIQMNFEVKWELNQLCGTITLSHSLKKEYSFIYVPIIVLITLLSKFSMY